MKQQEGRNYADILEEERSRQRKLRVLEVQEGQCDGEKGVTGGPGVTFIEAVGEAGKCVMDHTGHCKVFSFYSEMGHPGGFGAEEYECYQLIFFSSLRVKYSKEGGEQASAKAGRSFKKISRPSSEPRVFARRKKEDITISQARTKVMF